MVFGVLTTVTGLGCAVLTNKHVSKLLAKQIVTAICVSLSTVFVAWELNIVLHLPFLYTWLTVAAGQLLTQVAGIPLMRVISKRVKL